MDIPAILVEQFDKGELVLFCGMDLSASEDGLPTTAQLAQELAQHGEIKNGFRLTLPEVAERYSLITGPGYHSLVSYITERIGHPRYSPLPIHHLIAELPCQIIITTAWDTLLETAFLETQRPVTKIVKDSEISFVSAEKVSLIKLRGSIERKDSLVITGDNYYDVLQQRPQIANFVNHLLASKTVLFLGFGLEGEDFKRLYHSATRNLGQYKRRAFAVRPDPDPYLVQYWREREVQTIVSEPLAFLKALQEQSAVKTQASSLPTSTPTFQTNVQQTEEQAVDSKQIDRQLLLENLNKYFDEEELRNLSFLLEIEYDDLRGEGRANKARELLKFLGRRGRILELVTLAKELRPKVDWKNL